MKLEDLKKGVLVDGLVPGRVVTIVSADAMGADVVDVIFKCDGQLHEQQLFRADEARLKIAEKNLPWSFAAPSEDFKRVLEALRIHLGCRFDPMMAVHASNVIPLPHQIDAVYSKMLPLSPLRYVLADDPGAETTEGPYYVTDFVDHEPEPGMASVNYQLDYLLSKAKKPSLDMIYYTHEVSNLVAPDD